MTNRASKRSSLEVCRFRSPLVRRNILEPTRKLLSKQSCSVIYDRSRIRRSLSSGRLQDGRLPVERSAFLCASKGKCRINQRHVSESLRKITQKAVVRWVVFFGEQAHVVRDAYETIEKRFGLAEPSLEDVVVDEPAGRKPTIGSSRRLASR